MVLRVAKLYDEQKKKKPVNYVDENQERQTMARL